MPAFTEANQNTALRKRIPLREAFIEAYPELTPVLTLIPKKSGMKTVSEESSEVQWNFKTFRAPRNRPVFDGKDVDFSTESENNEANKTQLKGRIQLIRSAVKTGRIAQSVISQHGGVTADSKPSGGIHKDHVKDALRGMRTDKNFIIMSGADSKAQAVVSSVEVPYQTRGFASWCRPAHAHADLPIDSMARIPAGNVKAVATAAAFTEADLLGMMNSAWKARRATGNWKMFNCADMQTTLDNFLVFGELTSSKHPIRQAAMGSKANTIELHVKFYKGSFGMIESIPVVDMPEIITQSVTTVNTDATLTVADSSVLSPGMLVAGTGIAAGARILYIVDATHVELDAVCTASATVTGTFGETVFSELMDMEYIEYDYVDEVGWEELENTGGGPRGYADCLSFLAVLNPQAHMIVRKS